MSVDAKGYGSSDDLRQDQIQELLPIVFGEAATKAGLNREAWSRRPAGDGELAVLPDTEPEARVVYEYVHGIVTALARVNRYLRDESRLRLRIAVHNGVAKLAPMGFSGKGVVEVSRLLESSSARLALQRTGADLILIVSQRVFEDTIAQPHTPYEPSKFREVVVQEKEFKQRAWLYVPGHDVHAVSLDVDGDGLTPREIGPKKKSKRASQPANPSFTTTIKGGVAAKYANFGFDNRHGGDD